MYVVSVKASIIINLLIYGLGLDKNLSNANKMTNKFEYLINRSHAHAHNAVIMYFDYDH